MDRLGYCCINQTLRNTKPKKNSVYCSRGLIKRTFTLQLAGERALANVKDLLTILQWNEQNNIKVFRISSEIFPRFTCPDHGYQFEDLPYHDEIQTILKHCGDFIRNHNHCISFHPGPFTTLASPTPKARENAIKEIEYHTLLVSLIDPDELLDIPINFHVGGSYEQTYEATSLRFAHAFESLTPRAQRHVVIENDDKPNGWSVLNLYNHIYKKLLIPITYDQHHHQFCTGGLEDEDAFELAHSTWHGRNMQVHYSQSPTADKMIPAHSEYYRNPMPEFLHRNDIHVHLECKQKELALLKYRQDFPVAYAYEVV